MIALWWLVGCTYSVLVSATPPAALVSAGEGMAEVTPAEVRLRYRPFRPDSFCVSAPGYRAIEVSPQRRAFAPMRLLVLPVAHPRRSLGLRPLLDIDVVLVAQHGPSDDPGGRDSAPSACP